MLANLTPETEQVDVAGVTGALHLRSMDQTNVEAALCDPAIFDRVGRRVQVAAGDRLTLDLLPYAVAWIDAGE